MGFTFIRTPVNTAALIFHIDANSRVYIKHVEGTGCDGEGKGGGDWGEREEARERQRQRVREGEREKETL